MAHVLLSMRDPSPIKFHFLFTLFYAPSVPTIGRELLTGSRTHHAFHGSMLFLQLVCSSPPSGKFLASGRPFQIHLRSLLISPRHDESFASLHSTSTCIHSFGKTLI